MRANVRRLAVGKREELMKKRNVVGVMAGRETKDGKKTGNDAVVVLVEKKEDFAALAEADMVPRTFLENGSEVPTDVIEVGEIKALHKAKHRPTLPGTSIGHFAITAGTLGVVVIKDDKEYILSNNHVLANENNAQGGDVILQPGPADGGRNPDDVVAILSHYIPISFAANNTVDAALARFVSDVGDPTPDPDPDPTPDPDPIPPKPPEEEDSNCPVANILAKIINAPAKLFGRQTRLKAVRPAQVQPQGFGEGGFGIQTEGIEYVNEPLNLGPITKQLAEVGVGDTVQKSGRTTGVTVDEVLGVDAAANVSYDGGVAKFVDQIICGPMSAGGDSGSVVYDGAGNAIGLLFAGSDTVTIVNRIQDVFDRLDIERIA